MFTIFYSFEANKVCCNAHPDAVLIEDYRAGDQICSECGLVVGDRYVYYFTFLFYIIIYYRYIILLISLLLTFERTIGQFSCEFIISEISFKQLCR